MRRRIRGESESNPIADGDRVCGARSGGMRVQFGTEMKPLHAGLAAQAGLFAVKLAKAGFGGSVHALDGEKGFLDCTAILNGQKPCL